MLKIAVEEYGTDVYEGGGNLHAVYPPPILTAFTLVKQGENAEPAYEGRDLIQAKFLFREDSFDPTARIKRGRVYKLKPVSQPEDCSVYPHPARITEISETTPKTRFLSKRLATFIPHYISNSHKELGASSCLVLLGSKSAYSRWLIVDIEKIHTDEELLTLRAVRSLGSLPNIKSEMLPEASKPKILQTTDALSQDIHKSSPESVIDRARAVMTALLSGYLEKAGVASAGDDLGKLTKKLEKLPEEYRRAVAVNAAAIVARLHARAKPNEQEKRPLRVIMEQDAELAVSCVGVTLCDFGWAEWI